MNSNPLAKDFNTGSLLKFAFPTISMMLFMGLYTIVDTIFDHDLSIQMLYQQSILFVPLSI